MSEAHQYTLISIPREYDASQRFTIGIEIVELIKRRTNENLGIYGNRFPNYTEGYSKTFEFKVSGKSKNRPDLQLSGDMLRDLQVLDSGKGYIKVGFTPGSEENDKAAYVSEKRPFLGISPKDLQSILSRYPIEETIAPSLFDSIAAGILRGLFDEPK